MLILCSLIEGGCSPSPKSSMIYDAQRHAFVQMVIATPIPTPAAARSLDTSASLTPLHVPKRDLSETERIVFLQAMVIDLTTEAAMWRTKYWKLLLYMLDMSSIPSEDEPLKGAE